MVAELNAATPSPVPIQGLVVLAEASELRRARTFPKKDPTESVTTSRNVRLAARISYRSCWKKY